MDAPPEDEQMKEIMQRQEARKLERKLKQARKRTKERERRQRQARDEGSEDDEVDSESSEYYETEEEDRVSIMSDDSVVTDPEVEQVLQKVGVEDSVYTDSDYDSDWSDGTLSTYASGYSDSGSDSSVVSEVAVEPTRSFEEWLEEELLHNPDRPKLLHYRLEPAKLREKTDEDLEEEYKRKLARSRLPKSEQLLLVTRERDLDSVMELLDPEEQRVNEVLRKKRDNDFDESKVCDVNYREPGVGETALIICCKRGYFEIAEFLLTKVDATDLNIADYYGVSPLMHACKNGYLMLVRLLLNEDRHKKKKAQVYAIDADGWTPLTYAASAGHWYIVEEIISRHRADPSATTNTGNTALMEAALNGHNLVVKYLLSETDIDINFPNKEGDTAAHLAAKFGHVEVLRTLILDFADTELPNKEGHTVRDVIPSSFAVLNYNPNVWLLESHLRFTEQQKREKRQALDADDDYRDITHLNETVSQVFQFRPESIITVEREAEVAKQKAEERERKQKIAEQSGFNSSTKRPSELKLKHHMEPPPRLPDDEGEAKLILLELLNQAVDDFLDELNRGEQGRTDNTFFGNRPPTDLDEDRGSDGDSDFEPEVAKEQRLREQRRAWEREQRKNRTRFDDARIQRVEQYVKARTLRLLGDQHMLAHNFEIASELYEMACKHARGTDEAPPCQQALQAAAFQARVMQRMKRDRDRKQAQQTRVQAELRYATGKKFARKMDYNTAATWFQAAKTQIEPLYRKGQCKDLYRKYESARAKAKDKAKNMVFAKIERLKRERRERIAHEAQLKKAREQELARKKAEANNKTKERPRSSSRMCQLPAWMQWF